MAVEIPTDIPDELSAGDTWRWTRTLSDYPASEGGTLTYYFRGVDTLDVEATADGDDFSVTVAAATTAVLPAGLYRVVERITVDGVVTTLRTTTRTVLANAATATDGELQAHAERMVPILEAEIEARITGTGSAHGHYRIGEREITKIPLSELRAMLAAYRSEVAAAGNGGWPASIEVHFGRAS